MSSGGIPYKNPWHPKHLPEPYPRPNPKENAKDVITSQPASGPMSTDGPNGTSEGLPKTVEPFDKVNDAGKDCGSAMSLDAIKANAKRIGRY